MKKIRFGIILVLAVMLLSGCREATFDADENTVYVKKNKTFIGALVEDFAEIYYDADELRTFIDNEIKAYNASVGAVNLEVSTYEVESNKAKLFINYTDAGDYAGFNGVTFFAGTVEEALSAGYNFDASFIQVKDKGEVDSGTITSHNKYYVVITDEQNSIQVQGTIVYATSNVELVSKSVAKTPGGEIAYIVFK